MLCFGSWQRNIWLDCGKQQLDIKDIMNILYIVGDKRWPIRLSNEFELDFS